MGAIRGAVVGGLGLVTLYNVSTAPAGGVKSLFSLPGQLAHWLISPDVPLVPDLAGVGLSGTVTGSLGGSTPSSSSSSGAPIPN